MSRISQVIRRVESVHPVAKDTVLAVVLAGALHIDLVQQDLPPDLPFREPDPLGYVLVALLVLPLILRTVYPIGVFLTILTTSTAVVALLYRPASFGFGLLIATYTVARWRSRPVSG